MCQVGERRRRSCGVSVSTALNAAASFDTSSSSTRSAAMVLSPHEAAGWSSRHPRRGSPAVPIRIRVAPQARHGRRHNSVQQAADRSFLPRLDRTTASLGRRSRRRPPRRSLQKQMGYTRTATSIHSNYRNREERNREAFHSGWRLKERTASARASMTNPNGDKGDCKGEMAPPSPCTDSIQLRCPNQQKRSRVGGRGPTQEPKAPSNRNPDSTDHSAALLGLSSNPN